MASTQKPQAPPPLPPPSTGKGISWLGVIQDILNDKPIPVDNFPPGGLVGKFTPVWGIAERAVWGSVDLIAPPDPGLGEASRAYSQKVLDLQARITHLRVERGVNDPEYLEAQRLFNIMFR